jgi:hypothetical protein
MPLLAKHHVPVPNTDLLSWMFDNPPYDEDMPIYIDAANPSRSVSCRQARTMVRKLAAGLRKAGVQRGDCVCVGAFNDVSAFYVDGKGMIVLVLWVRICFGLLLHSDRRGVVLALGMSLADGAICVFHYYLLLELCLPLHYFLSSLFTFCLLSLLLSVFPLPFKSIS